MPPKQRQQMVDALQSIADGNPQSGLDVRALTNRPGYRLRIGQWRAIYERRETELVVLVLDVEGRGEIYK